MRQRRRRFFQLQDKQLQARTSSAPASSATRRARLTAATRRGCVTATAVPAATRPPWSAAHSSKGEWGAHRRARRSLHTRLQQELGQLGALPGPRLPNQHQHLAPPHLTQKRLAARPDGQRLTLALQRTAASLQQGKQVSDGSRARRQLSRCVPDAPRGPAPARGRGVLVWRRAAARRSPSLLLSASTSRLQGLLRCSHRRLSRREEKDRVALNVDLAGRLERAQLSGSDGQGLRLDAQCMRHRELARTCNSFCCCCALLDMNQRAIAQTGARKWTSVGRTSQ